MGIPHAHTIHTLKQLLWTTTAMEIWVLNILSYRDTPHYKVKTMQLWRSIFYVHNCNAFVDSTMRTWDYNDPPNLLHLRASSISRTTLQQTPCLFLLILQWFRALLLTTWCCCGHIPLTPPCKAHSRGTQAMSSHYFSWTESLWIQQLRNHDTQKIRKTQTHRQHSHVSSVWQEGSVAASVFTGLGLLLYASVKPNYTKSLIYKRFCVCKNVCKLDLTCKHMWELIY